ncbi:hypothetical protein D6810_02555 [Candidatus Dojkabacteria bacterium]|uniref:Uncharacterized protein n=1 Tax=Candidatus Dojkabacteria bacterium TaxID=2099670 RepID=A0A3M0YXT3_9BACT|nr:MAG: hypothetical protein D6810_02555 [Candidatus Dojkabacteria bacterium]
MTTEDKENEVIDVSDSSDNLREKTSEFFGVDDKKVVAMTSEEKFDEYCKLKEVVKTLNTDLKNLISNHERYQEWQDLSREVKKLAELIKEDEEVRLLKEKIATTKERIELLKEIIRIDLIENGKEEITKNGIKLKLISVIKEVKQENNKKTKKSGR